MLRQWMWICRARQAGGGVSCPLQSNAAHSTMQALNGSHIACSLHPPAIAFSDPT